MLALGVAATVAANAVEGASGGAIGVMVSAWPAVAFIGGIELLVWTARTARLSAPVAAIAPAPELVRLTAADAPEPKLTSAPSATSQTRLRGASGNRTKTTPEARAERRYADLLAAGELPSIRAIAREIKVGAPKAKAIRAHLATSVAA